VDETLTDLLARLKAEIESAEHGDVDRAELARLAGELEDRIAGGSAAGSARGDRGGADDAGGEDDERRDGLVDRLRESVLRFEGEHPDLANTIGRAADALSGMGL
jgi:hypothetical protein